MKRRPIERESDIQRTICDWLKLKRWLYWRNNSGGAKVSNRWVTLGIPGSPDIYVLRRDPKTGIGVLTGLEIKSAKTCQSQLQVNFEARLVAAGGRYFVCRSLQDAIDAFSS